MPELGQRLVDAALVVALIAPGVILHEVAHGAMAARLGDDTARRMGRLTLNPLAHVDPFGTVLLPLMLVLAGGPVFGWAKPVPINPGRFRRPVEGMALSALAGPATNLALAFAVGHLVLPAGAWTGQLEILVLVNLGLAVFNMLPIPPLDGSRLLPLVLSPQGRNWYARVEAYGFAILLAAVFVFPRSLAFLRDIIGWLYGLAT